MRATDGHALVVYEDGRLGCECGDLRGLDHLTAIGTHRVHRLRLGLAHPWRDPDADAPTAPTEAPATLF